LNLDPDLAIMAFSHARSEPTDDRDCLLTEDACCLFPGCGPPAPSRFFRTGLLYTLRRGGRIVEKELPKRPPRLAALFIVVLVGFSVCFGPPRAETATGGLRAGILLVSAPKLQDPNFFQTVVYLLKHDSSGSTGLIINRPTGSGLDKLLPNVKPIEGKSRFLFSGGPVGREWIIALLMTDHVPNAAQPVAGSIYFTGNKAEIEQAFEDRGMKVRLFIGHSGWSPGQLEGEILRGDWTVLDANPTVLFTEEPDSVWPDLLKMMDRTLI